MTILSLVVRLLALSTGLLALYVALLTDETEDGRIQSRLENLWLRLAYEQHERVSVVRQFVRTVVALADQLLDRVFGVRLLSLRSMAQAVCCAYGAIQCSFVPLYLLSRLAGISFVSLFAGHPIAPFTLVGLGAATGLVSIAAGTVPALHHSLRWVSYVGASLILLCLATLTGILLSAEAGSAYAKAGLSSEMPLMAVLGIAYGVAILHAMRHVCLSATVASTRAIAGWLGGTLAFALLPFGLLVGVAAVAGAPHSDLAPWLAGILDNPLVGLVLFQLGGANSLLGLGASVVLAMSLLLLAHRLAWRWLLMRVIYLFQRHRVIYRKGWLTTTGAGLLGAAASPASADDFLRGLLGALGRL